MDIICAFEVNWASTMSQAAAALGARASGHREEQESVPPAQLCETLGLGSLLLYPRPLLWCPGERGGYLGCYSLPHIPLLTKH